MSTHCPVHSTTKRCGRTKKSHHNEHCKKLTQERASPGNFLGEAIRNAVYLLNRLRTKALHTCIPYEAWFDKTPHFEYLRFFGCKTYVKTAKPYIKKLDKESQKMVYFGVENGTKTHRLYGPQNEKIHGSRDVVFEEEKKWDWCSVSDNKQTVTEFITLGRRERHDRARKCP